MSDLANIPTKELKEQLNTVLGEIEYRRLLTEYDVVAPYLVELLKRGYVSTARFSNVNNLGVDHNMIDLELYDLPAFVAYQTPFSPVVNYNKLMKSDAEHTKLRYAKGQPSGELEGGGYTDADDNFKPGWNVNWYDILNDRLYLHTMLSNIKNRPVYAFNTFDQLYNAASNARVSSIGKPLKLKVLTDQEVADLFDLDESEAKYFLVFGLREPDSPQTLRLTKAKFNSLADDRTIGLFPSLFQRRSDLAKTKANADPNDSTTLRDLTDRHFKDFIDAKRPNDEYTLQAGVDVGSINQEDFDKKYELAKQAKAPTEEAKAPTEEAKAPVKDSEPAKSNAMWWVIGGVAVSSAVYLAYKRRSNQV